MKKKAPPELPDWLPPATTHRPEGKTALAIADNIAILTPLNRGETDAALHGNEFMACCDCGLKHVVSFELWRDPTGQFVLNHRWIRDQSGTDLGRAETRRQKRKKVKK